jgi:hypothetical protein
MQLIDMLKNSGAVHSMAQQIGIDDDQATAGAAALMPALLGGLEKQTRANSEGLSGVASMLGGLGGGNMLDQVLGSGTPDLNAGNGVLGQLFGSKDVSRAVAQNASSSTGLDPALLKKMLPLLAMVVGGFVAKQAQARNADSADCSARCSAPIRIAAAKAASSPCSDSAARTTRSMTSWAVSVGEAAGRTETDIVSVPTATLHAAGWGQARRSRSTSSRRVWRTSLPCTM